MSHAAFERRTRGVVVFKRRGQVGVDGVGGVGCRVAMRDHSSRGARGMEQSKERDGWLAVFFRKVISMPRRQCVAACPRSVSCAHSATSFMFRTIGLVPDTGEHLGVAPGNFIQLGQPHRGLTIAWRAIVASRRQGATRTYFGGVWNGTAFELTLMEESVKKDPQPLFDLANPILPPCRIQNVGTFTLFPFTPYIVGEKCDFGRTIAEAEHVIEKEVL